MTDLTATAELELARTILEAEAKSIMVARARLDGEFNKAINLMATAIQSGGKVVVTGVGKSGKVASKVAATLSSTGTLAVFLHPTEAAHGDLGIVSSKDAVLLFSHSGSSDEIQRILPSFKRLGVPLVAVVGNMKSPLALAADVRLSSEIEQEACPLNLAPTSSTTVSIALGDAIALCLSRRWNFKAEHFAIIHPAGALGRRLTLKVRDLMKSDNQLGWVNLISAMDEVVSIASRTQLGAVLVRDDQGVFVGLITDGDIRRSLSRKTEFFNLTAKDIMTRGPISISPDALAQDALKLMENRPSQISVLPVTIGPECVGLIRLHDLIGQV